jgi:peptidoglycan/xylan/chitin deacetylase (PgdA/CDA1 family)
MKAMSVGADVALPSPKGPRVLIYHQVGTGTGKQMEVAIDDFVWQMDWLATNREVVDLDTAIRRWGETEADRLVVLTFDDGYEDTYTRAFPLLRERDFPFTLYLATEMVERRLFDDVPTLTWNQIAEMAASGLMTLGAHTHTHRDLRGTGYDETRFELEISNHIIEQRTGIVPRHFAYPWGFWSERAHRVVKEIYETASLGAPVSRTNFDAHMVFRFPVQLSDGTRWFSSRVRGGLLMEERIRRRLRGYRPREQFYEPVERS